MNIIDIARESVELDILVQALTTAGLLDTVQNLDDITVFAPTDAAFAQLAADLGYGGDPTDEDAVFNFIVVSLTGLADNGDPIPLLQNILSYHIATVPLPEAVLTSAQTVQTALVGETITPSFPVLQDNEPDLIDPTIITPDIPADNGIIHLIDRVLLPIDIPGNDPDRTVAEIVALSGTAPDDDRSDFDLLFAALQTTGLDAVLDAEGLDATVFAPNDQAFINLARNLGFAGNDEAGALSAIVATLTALGSGDPVPLLTAILQAHVSPGIQTEVDLSAPFATIDTLFPEGTGVDLTIGSGASGIFLSDPATGFAVAGFIETDLTASNGIIHSIDQVIIPFDIPTSNGLNDVRILLGTTSATRVDLIGGEDNDLLITSSSPDDMTGNGGNDVFVVQDGGAGNPRIRDLIRDFVKGEDLIDVSDFASSFDQLSIENAVGGDGSVKWVVIGGFADPAVFVRFGDGAPLDAAVFTAEDFIFGNSAADPGPDLFEILDTEGRDDFITDSPFPVRYVMLDDGSIDTIRTFFPDRDVLDVSAFASRFSDLTITNRENGAGVTSWVEINDATGETEILLRFDADTPLDASALDAADFAFGPIIDPDAFTEVRDTAARDDLQSPDGAAVYALLNDDTIDTIRFFEDGTDLIDVSAFASSFEDLVITTRENGAGVTRWLDVSDGEGTEVLVRFAGGTSLEIANLTADDFLFEPFFAL